MPTKTENYASAILEDDGSEFDDLDTPPPLRAVRATRRIPPSSPGETSRATSPKLDAPTATRLTPITPARFINLAASLTALLEARSGPNLMSLRPVEMCYLRAEPDKIRLTYEFDEEFFHGADTALYEPLVALLRAGSRRGVKCRHRIDVKVEHVRVMNGYFAEEESALVISVSREADEEDCRQQIEQTIRYLSRPGRISPLSNFERAMLGRPVEER